MVMQSTAKKEARISLKHSVYIADLIRGKPLEKAMKYLERVLQQKESYPNGCYYTNATRAFLSLLKEVKANAEFKGMAPEKLLITHLKADKGYRFIKPKSRARFRGRKAKITYLEITVEER